MASTFVIVGAGQAAAQLVSSLRTEGFEERIVLIGDEPHLPYQRPPLSKRYLAGEMTLDRVYLKNREFYQKADVDLMLGQRVASIEPAAHRVELDDGRAIGYDRLALATGSRVRELPVPGVDLEGIHYLRTLHDVDGIRNRFQSGRKLVIVGGGYIGLEVAAVAVKAKLAVTVLEMADRVLGRVVAPEVSSFYARLHVEHGVEIRTGTQVTAFEGNATVQRVLCDDGSVFDADLVIIGIGIRPSSELAAQAGLATDNGILVDECARTSDPDIVAAGDCTNHPNSLLGRRLRLESVQNAIDQAKVAAAALCDKPREYAEVPRFWSDQYDFRLQIAGIGEGYDQLVLRGDPREGTFAAFYLRQGRLLAVNAVNRPQEFALSRSLIAKGTCVDAGRLANPAASLKEVAV